jgi:hypothetical protein
MIENATHAVALSLWLIEWHYLAANVEWCTFSPARALESSYSPLSVPELS